MGCSEYFYTNFIFILILFNSTLFEAFTGIFKNARGFAVIAVS